MEFFFDVCDLLMSFSGIRGAAVLLAVLAIVFGMLWLILGWAAGGWWKGPLLTLAGLSFLAWRWRAKA